MLTTTRTFKVADVSTSVFANRTERGVMTEREAIAYACGATGQRMGYIKQMIDEGPNSHSWWFSDVDSDTIRIPANSLYDGGCAVDLIAV